MRTFSTAMRPAALAAALATGGGCATTTTPVVVGGGATLDEVLGAYHAVVVLRPSVSYELVSTEHAVDPRAFGVEDPAGTMTLAALDGLSAAGFQALQVDSTADAIRGTATNDAARLVEEATVLVGQYKDKTALLPVLAELGGLTGAPLVCVHTLTVKVGAGASWNMNSGAVAQGTSSSAVRVALLRASDGTAVWRNECLVRDLPQGRTFAKTVRAMYVTSKGRVR